LRIAASMVSTRTFFSIPFSLATCSIVLSRFSSDPIDDETAFMIRSL
jgi:hypothetical protein